MLLRLTGTQLEQLRSYLWRIGHVKFQYSKKDLEKIDEEVGLDRIPPPVNKKYWHDWAERGQGAEEVNYWNMDLIPVIENEVDLHIRNRIHDEINIVGIPDIEYVAPGFNGVPGVAIMFGGDHGDKNLPFTTKIQISHRLT